ncbi:class I SAM-dependent methyltransferase [Paenibacillus macerans]|uniref:class I SAM-dependent methyltransferase n=1 Tax=Paenibacillus macerans TaxID=44252 RepID=UPI00204058B6|nr:class I SAM-dependent methyltransferase [Paenibacillus macerans]MCM3703653.1 class I SAM-dependent methyltransferase [Paenibacillus macerans]
MPVPVSSILSALFLFFALLAMLSIVYKSWRNGISPMPASAEVRRAVAAELNRLTGQAGGRGPMSGWMPADGRKQAADEPVAPASAYSIVEAGSGWGTLALHLAKSRPDWRITGIENSWIPWAVSRLALRLSAYGNTVFIRGDLYEYRYEQADAVVCYLYPGAMKRLDPLLRRQLRTGARIVSVCFALPGWQAERVITCRDMYRTKIYVYKR